jgi:FkbM family methyltransferase
MLLLQKALLNFKLDVKWMARGPLPVAERLAYMFQKYAAILGARDYIGVQGLEFHYDNRLTPALLTDYFFEAEDLSRRLEFSGMRTVLDIGANVGQFSFALKRLYPHLEVASFEPNRLIFPILEKNAKLFSDWRCFPFGIGDGSRTKLYYVPGKSGQGSIYPENAAQGLLGGEAREIEARFKLLDTEECARLGLPSHFDLIKVDVEGAELEVLKSLGRISWRYLYVELSIGRKGGVTAAEALSALGAGVTLMHSTTPEGPSGTFHALFKRDPSSR